MFFLDESTGGSGAQLVLTISSKRSSTATSRVRSEGIVASTC
jgi:hypothetical protein